MYDKLNIINMYTLYYSSAPLYLYKVVPPPLQLKPGSAPGLYLHNNYTHTCTHHIW